MRAHLALCCKATLPILSMGYVTVRIVTHTRERPLLNATRCLMKQPSGASHLEVNSWNHYVAKERPGTHHLIDLRCARAPMWCWCVQSVNPALLCQAHIVYGVGLGPMLLCASAAC